MLKNVDEFLLCILYVGILALVVGKIKSLYCTIGVCWRVSIRVNIQKWYFPRIMRAVERFFGEYERGQKSILETLRYIKI